MDEYVPAEVRSIKVEIREVLGEWRARMVVNSSNDEGEYSEPYVLTAEYRALDMVGPGWQALSVLQEFQQHLSAALRDGYE